MGWHFTPPLFQLPDMFVTFFKEPNPFFPTSLFSAGGSFFSPLFLFPLRPSFGASVLRQLHTPWRPRFLRQVLSIQSLSSPPSSCLPANNPVKFKFTANFAAKRCPFFYLGSTQAYLPKYLGTAPTGPEVFGGTQFRSFAPQKSFSFMSFDLALLHPLCWGVRFPRLF